MANYLQPKRFENTNIVISDWITNTTTLSIFNSEDYCIGFYLDSYDNHYYYKIVKFQDVEERAWQFVANLPSVKNRKKHVFDLIEKHYQKQTT
ncbi:hypothetical protein [Streptococcus suis]